MLCSCIPCAFSMYHGINFYPPQVFLKITVEGTAGLSSTASARMLSKPMRLLEKLGSSLQGVGITNQNTTGALAINAQVSCCLVHAPRVVAHSSPVV